MIKSWKIKSANIEFLRSEKVRNYMAKRINGDSSINVSYDLNGKITGILYPPYNLSKGKLIDCATLGVKKSADGKYSLTLHLVEDVDHDVQRTLEETVKEFNKPRQAVPKGEYD